MTLTEALTAWLVERLGLQYAGPEWPATEDTLPAAVVEPAVAEPPMTCGGEVGLRHNVTLVSSVAGAPDEDARAELAALDLALREALLRQRTPPTGATWTHITGEQIETTPAASRWQITVYG